MRVREYISKANGVRDQKGMGNTGLADKGLLIVLLRGVSE